MDKKQVETPLFLDVQALAHMLGLSVRTIWRLHDEGAIPRALRIGRRSIRWDRRAIIRWTEDGCPRVSRTRQSNGTSA